MFGSFLTLTEAEQNKTKHDKKSYESSQGLGECLFTIGSSLLLGGKTSVDDFKSVVYFVSSFFFIFIIFFWHFFPLSASRKSIGREIERNKATEITENER